MRKQMVAFNGIKFGGVNELQAADRTFEQIVHFA